MKMSPADQTKYPKLKQYASKSIPEVIKVPSIVHAMNKVGQLKRQRFKTAITWGQGPLLKITPLVGAYGEFTPNTGSNEIRIQTQIVEDFEKGRGVKKSRAGKVYLVGVTLLHELVHWGDDQDGADRPGEEGEEFEKLVYGWVIY